MNTRQERASKIVKMVLRNAINRLNELSGNDKIAFASEYKEWMNNPNFNYDVWFSTDKNLSDYIE